MNNAYERTTSAVEKLQLSKDIPAMEERINTLLKQRNNLVNSIPSIDKLKTFDDKSIVRVIVKSNKDLSNNDTLKDNPTYKVTVICKNNIDQADKIVQKEQENYLKNAEMYLEGNYDMIDGVLNNVPPQKEPSKEDVKTYKVKPQPVLSRKEIVAVGKKQKEMQQKNKERTQERAPER